MFQATSMKDYKNRMTAYEIYADALKCMGKDISISEKDIDAVMCRLDHLHKNIDDIVESYEDPSERVLNFLTTEVLFEYITFREALKGSVEV